MRPAPDGVGAGRASVRGPLAVERARDARSIRPQGVQDGVLDVLRHRRCSTSARLPNMTDQLLLVEVEQTGVRCRTCGVEKSEAEFHRDSSKPRGRSRVCSSCTNDRLREWAAARPGYWRRKTAAYRKRYPGRRREIERRSLLKKYGLTLEEYEELLAEQDGVCAICLRRPSTSLHVDHDHRTGHVRGLLCGRCNPAIGLFAESPSLLARAMEYLRKHGSAF